jgi:glycosyltransferase involved in cell wall biosynthesis
MKILFVTSSIPYPPRNGVELPIVKLIQNLSLNHKIDLTVLADKNSDINRTKSFKSFQNKYLNNFQIFKQKKENILISVLKELFLIKPLFCKALNLNKKIINNKYDFIWFSPIGTIFSLNYLKFNKKKPKIVIGLHESTVLSYSSYARQIFKKTYKISIGSIIKTLRIPWIYYYEYRILKKVDLVTVQTNFEKEKLNKLYRNTFTKKTIILTNGTISRKPSFSAKNKKKNILFNSHLSIFRKNESDWFLTKVWPLVQKKNPDAILNIFGTPIKDKIKIKLFKDKNIILHGYIDNIEDIYSNMMISVLPTQHSLGWINRLSDSLVFGVPVVSCSGPLSTIPKIVNGKHALCADTPKEFSESINILLNDENKRRYISEEAIMLSENFLNWEQTTKKIEKKMKSIL